MTPSSFVPSIFSLFSTLTFSEKVIAISVIALVAIVCILQVIIANKNRETQKLRKRMELMPPTTERLVKGVEEQAEYTQKGKGIKDIDE
jgi:hypothetical protein